MNVKVQNQWFDRLKMIPNHTDIQTHGELVEPLILNFDIHLAFGF